MQKRTLDKSVIDEKKTVAPLFFFAKTGLTAKPLILANEVFSFTGKS
jgi:hypothetical protein